MRLQLTTQFKYDMTVCDVLLPGDFLICLTMSTLCTPSSSSSSSTGSMTETTTAASVSTSSTGSSDWRHASSVLGEGREGGRGLREEKGEGREMVEGGKGRGNCY